MSSIDEIALRYRLQRADFSLDVALQLPLSGITGIFGASGSGKTTLLRCIAGLEAAPGSELVVTGECWQDATFSKPPHERQIGYVFQEPRLFKHLDVRANIEYGMRRSLGRDTPAFEKVIALLGIEALLERKPAKLSGGEAQRVAIARALLRAPRFVLMDEPLASLDAARKNEILPYLERLHAESSIPIIYVSHNIDEICCLCDHLVVLDQGRVAASGELQSVLVRMDLPQVMGDAAGSILDGRIANFDAKYSLSLLTFAGGELWLPGRLGNIGDRYRLRIRANDVSLSRTRPQDTTVLNLLDVVIEAVQDAPPAAQLIRVLAGQQRLVARITRRSRENLNLQPGDRVVAQVKAVAVSRPNFGE
ncbi:MAG: molybdenum ABC transporter ATP-binding protein [Proteobacteria bacterium]|nr:molybdenum ABC transporter ATP-binding protein [Pseudomonadota bacterium]